MLAVVPNELLRFWPGDVRILPPNPCPPLPDRLWAPSSACDLTSGNSTLLLDKRASLSDCIPVHFSHASIVFYAPGFSASRGRYLGRACPPRQVVLLLVVLLGRGDAHHPCSFLPRTAALEQCSPFSTASQNIKQPTKKALPNKLDKLPDVPYPIHRFSPTRAGPRPLVISSWLVRCTGVSPLHTAPYLIVCMRHILMNSFLTIIHHFHLSPDYDTPYQTSRYPTWNSAKILVLPFLYSYLSTRYPKHHVDPTTTFRFIPSKSTCTVLAPHCHSGVQTTTAGM